jgi:hypothetical protein
VIGRIGFREINIATVRAEAAAADAAPARGRPAADQR